VATPGGIKMNQEIKIFFNKYNLLQKIGALHTLFDRQLIDVKIVTDRNRFDVPDGDDPWYAKKEHLLGVGVYHFDIEEQGGVGQILIPDSGYLLINVKQTN
jgi:hypothetical protein